jgi:hypothetical protein
MTHQILTSKVAKMVESYPDIANTIAPKVSPTKPGLTLVVVNQPYALPHARSAFENAALCHQSKFGPPMLPKETLTALHSGSARSVEAAAGNLIAENTEKYKAKKEHMNLGCRNNFNFCSDEGLCVLLPLIEKHKGQWITAQQTLECPLTPQVVHSLARIHETAVKADATVMMFLSINQSYEDIDLYHYYDFFEVTLCDPDPGFQRAFSVQCVNLKDLHVQGVGHVMFGVKWKDGKINRQFSPMISTAFTERLMWTMRCQGSTLEAIGKTVRLHKSNVKRTLDALPPLVKSPMKEGWLPEYLELLELDAVAEKPIHSKQDEDEDDFNDEDDLDADE